jgi:CRP/FNR family transcriptional regulator, cyclic AMP receptor protein
MSPSVDDARIKLLGGTALFGGLSVADLASIAQYLRPVAFKANQLIFSRGDEGRDIYFVTEGRVRLSILSGDGRELSLTHAAAGDFFGEIAALDAATRSADATALGPTKGFNLPQSGLKILLETNPRVATAAIHFLCRRIRATNEKLEAIALHPIEVRIARFLLTALKLQKIPAKDGKAVIDLAMSQGELALLVGASRPKVNIALTLLEEREGIVRDGMRVTCNIDVLEDLAAGEA